MVVCYECVITIKYDNQFIHCVEYGAQDAPW